MPLAKAAKCENTAITLFRLKYQYLLSPQVREHPINSICEEKRQEADPISCVTGTAAFGGVVAFAYMSTQTEIPLACLARKSLQIGE